MNINHLIVIMENKTMKNRIIYNSPPEAINKTRIKIRVDSGYERIIPDYYTKNNVPPIYDVSGEQCISFVTISEMVEMIYHKVSFEIYDDEDTLVAIMLLNNYIQYILDPTMRSEEHLNNDHKLFIDMCRTALTTLESHGKQVIYKMQQQKTDVPFQKPKNINDVLMRIWR